jgi:hypothetical protein
MKSKLAISLLATAVLTGIAAPVRADDDHHHRVTVRVVQTAPPAPRVVERVPAPGEGYVYTNGYWDYADSGWTWVDGRWVRPPSTDVTWVGPEYVRVGDGWEYAPGHWSNEVVYDTHGKAWKKLKKAEKKVEKKLKKAERELRDDD